jgi:hypothetical protein
MALSDDLLTELKGRLQITWSESDTVLGKMLLRGQNYFNEVTGVTLGFSDGSAERELLMERCRYDWNNALDDFETNFQKELSRLIMQKALDDYEAGEASGTGTNSGDV